MALWPRESAGEANTGILHVCAIQFLVRTCDLKEERAPAIPLIELFFMSRERDDQANQITGTGHEGAS